MERIVFNEILCCRAEFARDFDIERSIREVLACRVGCLTGVKAKQRCAHRERRALPNLVAAVSGANRGGNSCEELKPTSVEVMVLMKGLTMLRASSYQPYSIGVIAAAK
jgi:hypothetical protein